MRIAVWHNLPGGGGKRALYNHVKALKERGHYLEAWTTDFSSDTYLPLSQMIIEHRKPISSEIMQIRSSRNPLKKERETISLLKRHCIDCIDEIKDGRFDIIFANSCSVTGVPFIGLSTKIPSVLYLGEPDRKLFEAGNEGNIWELPEYSFSLKGINRMRRDFIRNYAYRLLIREQVAAAKSFSVILVNSFYSREAVKRAYGTDSAVCYLGVDEKIFFPIPGVQKKNYVAGMGRISASKNPETAISSLAMIPEIRRPVLKWISNEPVHDHLEKINKLAKDKKVEFVTLTDLPDNEVVKVLNEASVMICTSRLEPFGLAPVEANMCGTSVIAVAEGGFRESIKDGENGFLISADTESEIARLADRFCSDLQYAKDMGDKAREFALRNWSFSRMSDNIDNELRNLTK
ncbi:MAG TPA: glycosyltransferase family 4 protein [Bacteroidales bacterium]|nr:glycosyltransferase family 4 protein [Bacteroidales bacterium]